MSVIDDLKRLERAGDECSETNRKLCAAARRVISKMIEHVEKVGPGFPLPDQDPLELPRGYRVGWIDATELGEDQPGYEPVGVDGSHPLKLRFDKPHGASYIDGIECVEDARLIAQDVATGWLAEVVEWIQSRGKEDEEFLSELESNFSLPEYV
jgi:hypothetical protein